MAAAADQLCSAARQVKHQAGRWGEVSPTRSVGESQSDDMGAYPRVGGSSPRRQQALLLFNSSASGVGLVPAGGAGEQAGVLDMSAFSGDGRWVVARKGLAELLGTALLLFLGCMGGVGGLSESPPPHLQVALTFGLVVGIIIQIIGHITDAHLNPAVTAAAVILDRMTLPVSAVYVVSQLAGGVLGYGMLLVVTPRSALEAAAPNGSRCALCVTLPHAELSAPQAVLAEALVTAVLILVVCSVWDPRNAANTDSVPLKFGFTVAAIAAAEGPYTGASMNPARSLGPVIWTGVWSSHWVYWVGPMLGAVVAAYTYKLVWGVPAPRGPAEVTEESLPLRDVRNSKEVEARASATNLSSA